MRYFEELCSTLRCTPPFQSQKAPPSHPFPKKAKNELKATLKGFNRHALHSKKITLIHPESGKSMSWKSELPEDMQRLLSALKDFDCDVN